MQKALVFGGGNIGRGFLGVLLRQSDYDVTFVDVDQNRVNAINRYKGYPVFVCSQSGITEESVEGVNAIHFNDTERLIGAICGSDVILTAVGRAALQHVAKPLALGLMERSKRRPNTETHVIVIACENVRDNTAYLADFVKANLDAGMFSKLQDNVSFPNCIVDRIVPNSRSSSEHPLATTVEKFFQFVVDGSQLQVVFPPIKGVEVIRNVSAKLDQKLFTLNMAHGITGYYGLLRGYHYVHEAIADADILALVKGALEEVEEVMVLNHPSISRMEQQNYAQTIIGRFRNQYLQDELLRVASQPKRKLGGNERLVKPACLLWDRGRIPAYLATGIASGFRFHDGRDKQADELATDLATRGLGPVIQDVSGLSPEHPLSRTIQADYLLQGL